MEISYACVFCGRPIDSDAHDSCDLTASATGGVANFWAHVSCFRDAAHDREHFPDLLTVATPPNGYEPPSAELVLAWDELDEALAEIRGADLDLEQTRALIAELRRISEPFYDD